MSFAEAEALGEPVVGYLGYDVVAELEPTVPLPDDGPGPPVSLFVVPELLVRFDHARGIAQALIGDPEDVAEVLAVPQPELPRGTGKSGPLRRFPERDEHLRRIERAKEHIREGDVFQVVISQRAERPTSASALELYRALRRVNPSPYLFLLELDDLALVGSSPETVVKCEGSRAELNPIAGTIAPGEGDAEALLSSEKDRAEHVMLVDLGRNDLSRVCVPGTVRVERFMEAERYSHVTHLVSEVVGELRDGCTPFELLRACFPAGTVSGAPKVRAMQIISELEGHRRGIYAGAVGYVFPQRASSTRASQSGRSSCVTASRTCRQAAASPPTPIPAAEHQECLNKLGALEAAIEPQSRSSAMILLIDNYDSFTYNLAHLFGALGVEVKVLRNDELNLDDAERLAPSHLIVSPGPGRPADAGVSVDIVRRLGATTPTLGVCLGHQAIVEAFGGEVGYARELLHGKASPVKHDGTGIFTDLPEPFDAGRYHSLAATRLPDVLEPTALPRTAR